MIAELLASLRLLGLTIAICVIAYPLGILAVAAVVAPEARMGSLIYFDGRVVGSRLVAQDFSRPEYFWPRPSAVGYNASAAAGSNLSPANLLIRERAEALIARLDMPEKVLVPVDLVTASGGGLDPHISYQAASVQAKRVAKVRGLGEDEVRQLVDRLAEGIPLMSDGEKIVNVLLLNLSLEELAQP